MDAKSSNGDIRWSTVVVVIDVCRDWDRAIVGDWRLNGDLSERGGTHDILGQVLHGNNGERNASQLCLPGPDELMIWVPTLEDQRKRPVRLEKTDQKQWWVSIEPNGGVSLFSRAVTEHELMETWNKLSVALAVFGFSEKMIAEGAVEELLHSPMKDAQAYASDLINQPMVRHVKRDEFPKRWRNNAE